MTMQAQNSRIRRDGGHAFGSMRKTLLAGLTCAAIAVVAGAPSANAADDTSKNCVSINNDNAQSCLGLGIAVGGFFFTEPDIVGTAIDPGTRNVRITEEHQREGSLWLEVHDTFVPVGGLISSDPMFKGISFGPFAALQLGGTNGTLTSFAVGGMLFFPTRFAEDSVATTTVNKSTGPIAGFGLGLGYGWTQIHKLGDGIVEGQALSPAFTSIPMKQSDIGGIVVMLSTTVAL